MIENPTTDTFVVGSIVSLRSDPQVCGPVVGVTHTTSETRYDVWLNGRKESLYASQLLPYQQQDQGTSVLPFSEFRAVLTALQITNPSLSTLHSLNSARIDYIPYQFRPVLKFMRSDRPRLLIADEVGVGKTIEAGLILRELQARSELNSVMIICPKALITERKWEKELRRFDEDFTPLDGPLLRHCLGECDMDGAWPAKYQKCIVPFSLFDSRLLE